MRYAFPILGVLIFLSGCREFAGPAWSPDGKNVAYTAYSRGPNGSTASSVYLLDATTDGIEPQLIANNASTPRWMPDSTTFYFMGDRDQQGAFTKLYRVKLTGDPKPEVAMTARLTDLQISNDGRVGILCSPRTNQPGGPVSVEIWHPRENKKADSKLGEVYSPALSPNGNTIAYSQHVAGKEAMLMIAEVNGNAQPQAVFPTKDESEPNASSYTVYAFPNSEQFLFYAPGGTTLWTINRNGAGLKKFQIPDHLSSPLMVSISDDSTNAVFTAAKTTHSGKVLYDVYKLEFASKRLTRMETDSATMIGGYSLDPRTKRKPPFRYAWLAAAGLAVGDQAKASYFPLDVEQLLAASSIYIKQNDATAAIAAVMRAQEIKPQPDDPGIIERALATAYLAAKNYERTAACLERAALRSPVGSDGLQFIFPPDSGLPRQLSPAAQALSQQIDSVIAALPDNKLLPLLRDAQNARLAGEHRKALALYAQTLPLIPDQELVGGVTFLQAMTAFEIGDLTQAGERWEAAARSREFSQADYAAGLSAIAFALDGHGDSSAKSAAVLQMQVVKKSPMAGELSPLAGLAKGKVFREKVLSDKAVSRDESIYAWIEYEKFTIPYATLRPQRVEESEGKFAERRIGVRTVMSSAVWVARMAHPLMKISRQASVPAISPSGQLVAFMVKGEVFPLADSYCQLYVVDSKGKIVYGDARMAAHGEVHGRRVITSFAWVSDSEIRLEGSDVDVFGSVTPFQRRVNLLSGQLENRPAPAPKPDGAAGTP